MIGSVFSPYYAWSGRKQPHNHVALNVGLYGGGKKRWTMTERAQNAVFQSEDRIDIGPSSLTWENGELTIDIDEWANPIFRKVKGQIRIHSGAITDLAHRIDTAGNHAWFPVAPCSRAEVSFENPTLNWSGDAYVDCNWGSEPLETGFQSWNWARAHLREGTGIHYASKTRTNEHRRLSLRIDEQGKTELILCPPSIDLTPGPIWRVARSIPAMPGVKPKTLKTLEDTPFYTRSHVATEFDGEAVVAVHESLDCDRYAANWVRCLLPFRMPRRR